MKSLPYKSKIKFMKILYITDGDVSKVEHASSHFFSIADKLQNRGHIIKIIAPIYTLNKKNILQNANIKYLYSLKKSIFGYLLFQIKQSLHLPFCIIKFKPDIVYSVSGFINIIPVLISKFFVVPYVIEVNGIVEDELRMRGKSELLIKILSFSNKVVYKLSSGIVCVTQGIKQEIISKFRSKEGEIYVIPNGADAKLFIPIDKFESRKKIGVRENVFVVGFVGTFRHWQGLHVFVEAIKLLKNWKTKNIQFLIIGRGDIEYERKLKILCEKYDLDNVSFIGRIPHDQVVYYINSFDVAIAPFIKERNDKIGISPLKIFEYLACAKPVITTKVKGVKEIIESARCGYLVEPDNSRELAVAIKRAYMQSPNKLREIGARGRKPIERNFNWDKISMKLENILKRVRDAS